MDEKRDMSILNDNHEPNEPFKSYGTHTTFNWCEARETRCNQQCECIDCPFYEEAKKIFYAGGVIEDDIKYIMMHGMEFYQKLLLVKMV